MLLCFDEFVLDAQRLELRHGAAIVRLDPLLLRLLTALVRNADRVMSKHDLSVEVWRSEAAPRSVITAAMARLRKKLAPYHHRRPLIRTVYGSGYRFEREVQVREVRDGVRSPPATVRDEPPFAGRVHVLQQLHVHVTEAYRERGGACLLLGEPGIGKTRTASQFVRSLASTNARVAWGFCREGAARAPLEPWLRILRTLYDPKHADRWKRHLGPIAQSLQRLLESPQADERTALDAGWDVASRQQTFDLVAQALRYAARRTPWVLILDDLQHADPDTLALTTHLLDELSDMRVVLLATLRTPFLELNARVEGPLGHLLDHREVKRLKLDPLPEEDVRAYVAALIPDPDGRWGRSVFTRSEGNPFLMTAMVKQLQGGEVDSADALQLPHAALNIVRSRIAGRKPETRAALAVAALLGRSFDLWLLQAVSQKPTGALVAALEEAVGTQLLAPSKTARTEFAFTHELVRTALYDELPRVERRDHHLRAAVLIEQRGRATRKLASPMVLAHHYYAAFPTTDLAKTARYCEVAARHAASLRAREDVERYCRNALDALALLERPDPAARLRLMLRMASHSRARADVFIPTLVEVVRLARGLRDGAAMMRAGMLSLLHPELEHVAGASEVLGEALSMLPASRPGMRAIALSALACTGAPGASERMRAQSLLEEAERLAQAAASPEATVTTLLAKLHLRGAPSAAAFDLRTADALEQLRRAHPDRFPALPLYLARSRTVRALQRGDVHGVRSAIRDAATAALALNDAEASWHSDRAHLLLRLQTGGWREPVSSLKNLHQRARQQGLFGAECFTAFDRAVLFGELGGEGETVDDMTRRALRSASTDAPSIWSMKVRALLAAGLASEARAALYLRSPAALRGLPHDSQYLGTLGHLARVAVELGALEYVDVLHQLLSAHEPAFAGHVALLCEGSVAQLRGMLAMTLGRYAEAVPLLEQGIAHADRAGMVLASADARLTLARVLQRHPSGRPLACSLAQEAQAIAAQLGERGRLAQTATALLSSLAAVG